MLAAEREDPAPSLHVVGGRDLDDVAIDVEPGPPRLEPGEYIAAYTGHHVVSYFAGRALKLVVEFELLVTGGQRVHARRYFNVKRGRAGRLIVGPTSDCMRELSQIAGRRLRAGRGEIAPRALLAGKLLRVRVRDVVRDREQRELGDVNVYSVVHELLAVEAGS